MDNTKLFNTEQGQLLISSIFGCVLGSLLFTIKCKSNCITYELKDNELKGIYNYNNICYKFEKQFIN